MLQVHTVSFSKYLFSYICLYFFFLIEVISLVICCFQTTQIREIDHDLAPFYRREDCMKHLGQWLVQGLTTEISESLSLVLFLNFRASFP